MSKGKWRRGETRLSGQELGENVGEDTTLRDDDGSEELVELLVVADSELEVTGNDTRLLVVTGGVTGELEDLGGEVLEDGSEVDGGAGTDTLGVVAALQETVDTTDGDWLLVWGTGYSGMDGGGLTLETRLGGSGRLLRVRAGLAAFATGRHCCWLGLVGGLG